MGQLKICFKSMINPSFVLVQPRKTSLYITERLLMGCKESNQTNKQTKFQEFVIPLYTNRFFFLVCYIKLGIVHFTYLGVSGYNLKKNVFFCLNIFLTFTNSVDPDEMQHYAAFHLGLHCLHKYLFMDFPNTKGYDSTVGCILDFHSAVSGLAI